MQWKTVVCVVVVVAAIVVLALFGDDRIGAILVPVIGILGTAVAGSMRGMFDARQAEVAKSIPPPPKVPPAALGALMLVACSSPQMQRAEAAVDIAAYTLALDECRAAGKDAGSFAVYDRCANAADVKYGRDGGAK